MPKVAKKMQNDKGLSRLARNVVRKGILQGIKIALNLIPLLQDHHKIRLRLKLKKTRLKVMKAKVRMKMRSTMLLVMI